MDMTFAELISKHKVQIYSKYAVQVETANKMLGGWPKDPNMALAMLEARFNKGLIKEETLEAAREAIKVQSTDDHEEATDEAMSKAWTGYKSDDHGIYIESRQVKAAFKETAQVLGLTQSHRGVRQILQHSFFVRGIEDPDKIYLYRDGERLQAPDGTEQLIAHVITAQGPRSTIKYHDLVENVTFSFEVWFSDPKEGRMNEKFLAYCLQLMQDNGIGCSRSQGFGRIKVLTVGHIQDGSLPKSATATKKAASKKK